MKRTILLVDDEIQFVDSLAERLELRGFETLVAYGGLSALELFLQHTPSLVVLDLRLPDIDGGEVLKRIKEIAPDVRVIIITGHGSEDDRLACMTCGADGFMRKPLHIKNLVEALLDGDVQ
ncbi:MAG: response regulator [Proteobacteria bacterium]|nr:response regulator [Pseudomonadota bacterium]MBU1610417.1 response regulator [Pseudomonadota bacterium]